MHRARTVLQELGVTDAQFDAYAALVERDLAALRRVLEGDPGA